MQSCTTSCFSVHHLNVQYISEGHNSHYDLLLAEDSVMQQPQEGTTTSKLRVKMQADELRFTALGGHTKSVQGH